MVQFKLTDPEPLIYHNEPIIRDGEIVSYVTSGNYGHTLGGAIGMGYVPCKGESADEVLASSYEIEIAGNRVAAEASLRPMYDPKSERVKAMMDQSTKPNFSANCTARRSVHPCQCLRCRQCQDAGWRWAPRRLPRRSGFASVWRARWAMSRATRCWIIARISARSVCRSGRSGKRLCDDPDGVAEMYRTRRRSGSGWPASRTAFETANLL